MTGWHRIVGFSPTFHEPPTGMPLGRVAGVRIVIHASGFLAVLLVAGILAFGVAPGACSGCGVVGDWALGGLAAGVLFGCILLHELAHAVVARRHGREVAGIILLFFGAATAIKRQRPEPLGDFLIAAAGPAASLVLAALFWGAIGLPDLRETPVGAFLGYLAGINLLLGLLNLLPVAPMDGSRMLGAVALGLTGDQRRVQGLVLLVSRGAIALVGGLGAVLALHGALSSGLAMMLLSCTLAHALASARPVAPPRLLVAADAYADRSPRAGPR